MAKVSIWKRFGGWLGRTNTTATGVEVVSVDADRLGVGPNAAQINGEDNSVLATQDAVAEKKLAAIEDGFNRLVDVMGQVNETLTLQRRRDEQTQKNLEPIAELMRQFPTVVQSQSKLVDKLAEQFEEQIQQHEELADTLKTLPDQAQAQVEQLGDITHKLENSVQTESQMLENLKAQSASLTNVGHLLEKNDERFQAALTRQQKQLMRLFWTAIGLGAIALAAVATLVWFKIL